MRYLTKAFDNEKFASDFVEHGRFRMSELSYYRTIEDLARRDPSEGYSCSRDSRGGQFKGFFANPVYILCCSEQPAAQTTATKFGSFRVAINDAKQLASDVAEFFQTRGITLAGEVLLGKVKYDYGQVACAGQIEEDSVHRAIFHKPEEFSSEYEFRFVAVVLAPCDPSLTLGKHIDVDLGGPKRYLRLEPS